MVAGAAIDDQRQWHQELKAYDKMLADQAKETQRMAPPPTEDDGYNEDDDPNDFEQTASSSAGPSGHQVSSGYDEDNSDNDIGYEYNEDDD